MTRVTPTRLDSATFKGGREIAHAVRELDPTGDRMRVTMSGLTPDGAAYRNVSHYRRVAQE